MFKKITIFNTEFTEFEDAVIIAVRFFFLTDKVRKKYTNDRN